jgi:hypothetical protein
MWRTSRGNRVLKGAEAKVFASSVLVMLQRELFDEDYPCYGIPVFDTLTPPQRIATLHFVAQALFRPEVPIPEHTAVLEGAAATVIEHVGTLLKYEISSTPDETPLRSLVAKACREVDEDEGRDVPEEGEEEEGWEGPDASCDDLDEWYDCVEYLHDSILWDRDCLSEDLLVDLPPEGSEFVKTEMRIPAEYYQAIAPDPSEQQLHVLLDELVALCKKVYKTGSATAAAPRRNARGKKPAAKKPAVVKSSVKKAVAKKPVVKKPATKKPAAKKAAAKKPGGTKSGAKKPVAKPKKPGKKS